MPTKATSEVIRPVEIPEGMATTRVRCLRSFNYGKPTPAKEPTMAELVYAMASGKPMPEMAPVGEYTVEFKAGQVYELEAVLARRLLRDEGPIDYVAWRFKQSLSNEPIIEPVARANPALEPVDPSWRPQSLQAATVTPAPAEEEERTPVVA